jgi:hypothetical protein
LPPLHSRKAREFSYDFDVESSGAGRLEMHWRKFGPEEMELPLAVQIVFTLPPHSPLVFARAELHLPEELSAAGSTFLFPHFNALRLPQQDTAALFLPWGEGLLISQLLENLPQPKSWYYPGELGMQFAGLQFPGHRSSFYLAAQDAAGYLKGFRAGADGKGQFDFSLLNFPMVQQGRGTISYEMAFGWLIGDWLEAARAYRLWALPQAWAPTIAPPLSESGLRLNGKKVEPRFYGCWLLTRKPSQETITSALSLQRVTNGPIRLLWQWWQGCPGDSSYPDYLPPREGEAEFSQALGRLKEAGIRAWMEVDGSAASPSSKLWQSDDLAEQALLTEAGGFREIESNPFSKDNLLAMCSADGRWPARLESIREEIKRMGGAGLWLRQAGSAEPRCFAPAHAHPAGGGNYFAAAWAGLAREAAVSEAAELYLPFLEAAVTSGPSLERSGRPAGIDGDDWEPIPLRQAVYAPALSAVGLVGPLANHFPHDPFWPKTPPAPRAQEALLLQGDYSLQFCQEVGRSLLWGMLPGLVDYDNLLMEDPLNLRKLAFLRTILQVNATETALARGEFLGYIETEGPTAEVDFLVNYLYALPGQRRVVSRSRPMVQITAWRGRDGKLLLIIINLLEKAADFSCQLPLYRLGIAAPKKVYGLTFSPELGGSQALLALSGGRISGELPARSASIVWL